MKTCKECGGMFYAHGKFVTKTTGEINYRFRCKDCGRCVSIREDGRVVNGKGPRVRDWRTMGDSGTNGDAEGGIHGGKVPDKRDLGVQALEGAIRSGTV